MEKCFGSPDIPSDLRERKPDCHCSVWWQCSVPKENRGKMWDRDFISDFHMKTVDKLLSISKIYFPISLFHWNLLLKELQMAELANKTSIMGVEINITIYFCGLVYIHMVSTSVYKRNLRTVIPCSNGHSWPLDFYFQISFFY